MVGYAGAPQRALLWNNDGEAHGLGISSDYLYSFATAINSSGQIVGVMGGHAFLYTGNTIQDFGTLGGKWSYAAAINSDGQLVGNSYTGNGNDRHAFLYADGSMHDLGTLGSTVSEARAINDSGQVVGYNELHPLNHAFLWEPGSGMVDLNTLVAPLPYGWTLQIANGINNSGQIVGTAGNGASTRAFLLTPVPEPSTIALLATAAVGLLVYGWRRS